MSSIKDAEVDVQVADYAQPTPEPSKPRKKKKGAAETTVKKPKKRLRHSRWFITFNTNIRFDDREDPELPKVIAQLQTRVKELGLSKNLKPLMVFSDPTHEFTTQYIKKIAKICGSVEVGPKSHCVHTHIQLIVSHWSCIHLDYTLVKQFFKDVFPNGHGFIRVYPNDSDVKEYIRKHVKEDNDPEICVSKVELDSEEEEQEEEEEEEEI